VCVSVCVCKCVTRAQRQQKSGRGTPHIIMGVCVSQTSAGAAGLNKGGSRVIKSAGLYTKGATRVSATQAQCQLSQTNTVAAMFGQRPEERALCSIGCQESVHGTRTQCLAASQQRSERRHCAAQGAKKWCMAREHSAWQHLSRGPH